jgi:hypothetical protein
MYPPNLAPLMELLAPDPKKLERVRAEMDAALRFVVDNLELVMMYTPSKWIN